MREATHRIPARHGESFSGDGVPALLQRRSNAAKACSNALPTDLPWKFLAELAPMLQPPSIRELPAPAEEVPLLNDLLAGMARGLDPADPAAFAKHLTAAMFYFLPHELQQTPPPSRLPLWVRVPYLKWSLALPERLGDSADADLYAQWRERWLEVLAVEFGDGRGIQELPEYQHSRMRRLLDEQVRFEKPAPSVR